MRAAPKLVMGSLLTPGIATSRLEYASSLSFLSVGAVPSPLRLKDITFDPLADGGVTRNQSDLTTQIGQFANSGAKSVGQKLNQLE